MQNKQATKNSGERYCDTHALQSYPEGFRSMPFCVWRLEHGKDGRLTKVPYNPRTGYGAAVNRPATFAGMEDALRALEKKDYNGVGFNVSGKVGSIDIDHCVGEEGELSGTAKEVLAMLPDAFAEYSPSRRGLHLYFIVPEEFIFDADEYYINSRKHGLEIYLPGATKHFLTVTGFICRAGSMTVNADQLQSFLDTFMQRPVMEKAAIMPPENGSVLNDAEVLQICKRSQGGQQFERYFSGEWEKDGDVNWSHSEADMSVCRRLAFFTCGDIEQMDRLFRQSGLMRDKWDERRGNSTYGEITMTNAIKGCTSFYKSKPRAQDVFEDLDEAAVDKIYPAADHMVYSETDIADGFSLTASEICTEEMENTEHDAVCGSEQSNETDVNAEYPGNAALLDAWLSRDLSVEDILKPEFLELAMWANQEDLARYVQIKDKVPKKLGVRKFESQMKKQYYSQKEADMPKAEMLHLIGCTTPGMLVPVGWIVDDKGIRHMELVFGEMKPVIVSREPAYVSAKVINVDDDSEKLEVTYRRNGRYRSIVAARSDILNKNAIIKYADFGLPVSSATAAVMTKYLAEMEEANSHAIPVKRCINRAGWIGNEFYPYEMQDTVQYHDDDTGTTNLIEALHTHGSEEAWMDLAAQVRAYPFARCMLAVSFASPLLHKLSHRNLYVHVWYESRGGKTAVAKLNLGVWGDPEKLMGTYNATLFGLEQRCATLKHLPVVLDELQSLKEKYMSVNDIVYNLGNGVGKTRGKIGSGIRRMDGWNNCILSTGEQPMSTDSSMDGINTRLLEINGCPLMDEEGLINNELGIRLHTEARLNYGFAGKKYIRFLIHDVIGDEVSEDGTIVRLDADYRMILEKLSKAVPESFRSNPHFSNVAVLALADYYSSISVFGESAEQAAEEAIAMGVKVMERIEADKPMDSIKAAWNFMTGWVASNSAHFTKPDVMTFGPYPPKEAAPIYGIIEKKKVYVIANDMNKALTDAGFSYKKCIKGFQRAGYIDTFFDSEGKQRSQVAKVIKSVQTRVYALNLEQEELDDDMPAFMDDALDKTTVKSKIKLADAS